MFELVRYIKEINMNHYIFLDYFNPTQPKPNLRRYNNRFHRSAKVKRF